VTRQLLLNQTPLDDGNDNDYADNIMRQFFDIFVQCSRWKT